MDKANGDAPFIPLYGTAVPGAGLGRLAGTAAGLRARGQAARDPASTPRRSFGRSPPLRAGAYRARGSALH
ncbi:MAG: hypothetical protein ACLUES_04020 [Flavonifractor plautii]